MIAILEILLYLQLISPGQGYTNDQIHVIVNGNQQTVQSIQSNQNMMTQLDQQYGQQAQGIPTIDYDEAY